jgi:PKD repeat protein
MSALDLESNVNPGDKYVLLGTITVRAKGAGATNMTVFVTSMDGDEVTLIFPEMVVRGLVPFTDCTSLPTDPDGDGLYEDLNGNNRIDSDDISVYRKNIHWIPRHQPPRFFDYNLNGRIDSNDVIRLYKEMKEHI